MDLDNFDFNGCHRYLIECISKYKISDDSITYLSSISHFINTNYKVACPDDLNRKTRLVYKILYDKLKGHNAEN